jgi:hypothetical protein
MIIDKADIFRGLENYKRENGLTQEKLIEFCGIGDRGNYKKIKEDPEKSFDIKYLLKFFESTKTKPSDFFKSIEKKEGSYPEGNPSLPKFEIKEPGDNTSNDNIIPFWDIEVTAGRTLLEIIGKNSPDGYVSGLPGAECAENILPVTGTSMEPEITSGAIIGVRKINNWDTLNTERIYLIITREDRMIKRIEHDDVNQNILWCVSPNYSRFKIYKEDIIEIHRVCFVYNTK